jgi:hypothetical protein
MKTPSGKSIVIVLAVVATVSIVIFQGCANEVLDGKKISVKIGKDKDSFVEFRRDKNAFDCALAALGTGNYQIRYKADASATPVDNYQPTCHHNTSLKTDSITTSELAENEPIGDPHVTQKIQSNSIAEIEKVLNTLKSSP